MKRLGHRANIVPVISKSDTLTPSEIAIFKKRVLCISLQVMADIAHYNIPIYDFPIDPEQDDEETVEENNELRAMLPFAVIGSEDEITVDGRRVRCRQYPWGIVESKPYFTPVDNPRHSDLSALRYMLLSSHLQDLKEITQDLLYEKYRTECLSKEAGEEESEVKEEQ